MMEVLVEIGDSRKAVAPFSKEIIVDLLDDKGYFVLDDEEDDGSPYILHRWSDKWHSYVTSLTS